MLKSGLELRNWGYDEHECSTENVCGAGAQHDVWLQDLDMKPGNGAEYRLFSTFYQKKTHVSGEYWMLKRFNTIFALLRPVAEDNTNNVAIHSVPLYESHIRHCCKMLHQIDEVTKFLQRDDLCLYECFPALDTITDTVERTKSNVMSASYNCYGKQKQHVLHEN